MNCKPGDLAVYIGEDLSMHGRIVRCVDLFMPTLEVWVTDPPLALDDGSPALGVWDSSLRPIRDPGDDAVDESRAWLPPVPLPKIEPSLLPEKETTNAQ